jgi:hypothetical protein
VPARCTFEIPGVATHEPAICGHSECLKASTPNRPYVAGNDRRSSSNSGQIRPNNRPDVAAKTFSPTERDRAGRAQGSAQHTGAVPLCASFIDDGDARCTQCGFPEANQRHRSKR